MIYLDNAATGGFKPSCVIDATTSAIKYLLANPGRSGHTLSYEGSLKVYSARKNTADFFGISDPSRVIFTKNCTESLNLAILGSNLKGKVLTSVFEHNSVLRPLYALEEKGIISLKIIRPENNRYITLSDVKNAFDNNVSMLCLTCASNVTGEISEFFEIGNFMKNENALYLVDGAQAGGHINIDFDSSGIDFLALACHKGLYSIMGLGALLLSKNAKLSPVYFGGTGSDSFNATQPDFYPERLECGTLNLPAICSLEQGVLYARDSIEFSREYLTTLTGYLIEKLSNINKIKIYSRKNPVGIVSFSVDGLTSVEVAEILSKKYNIAVRGGFHCSPLCHEFLGTEKEGLVRASLSPYNTKREINALILAVKDITSV